MAVTEISLLIERYKRLLKQWKLYSMRKKFVIVLLAGIIHILALIAVSKYQGRRKRDPVDFSKVNVLWLERSVVHSAIVTQDIVNKFRGEVIANIIKRESEYHLKQPCSEILPGCPPIPRGLEGKINVTNWLKGHIDGNEPKLTISPKDCTPRNAIAIIIPYRDRKQQLSVLLKYLSPILERQKLSYHFFVVEQVGNSTFNKGILMNAGALAAIRRPVLPGVMVHCLIFHDVDLLPEDDRIMYNCPEMPRHLSAKVDENRYRLFYGNPFLVGGVFAIKAEHFLKVNGYSNLYWGWGAEDVDMGLRVHHVFGCISRLPYDIARYTMLKHVKRKSNSHRLGLELKSRTLEHMWLDGLNTLEYKFVEIKTEKPGFTHLLIDVGHRPEIIKELQ